MIVECPNCTSTFNLDESLIPEEGRKVRCSVCENVFTAKKEEAQAPPEAEPEAASVPEPAAPEEPEDSIGDDILSVMDGDDSDDLDIPDDFLSDMDADDMMEEDAGDSSPDSSPSERESELDDDDIPLGDSGAGMGLDLDSGPTKKKKQGGKGKMIGIIVGVLLVLFLGVGAGLYFFAPGMLPFMGAENATMETDAGPAMPMEEQVKNIFLDGIRQYYVDNDKAGRIFVVEGRAVNRFTTPKELVEVEASLFDGENKMLDSVRILAGNSLSLFQLQVLAEDEIVNALKDEAGIGANNINLQPQAEVPFMIVFFNPPDTVAEFKISVVSVKDVDDL